MKIIAITFIILTMNLAHATVLNTVLEKYAKSNSLQFDIKKIDEKLALGTLTENTGVIKYQKNKIYMSQNGSKKVELFYANRTLHLVENVDADFGAANKRKVTIIKKAVPPLINSLLNLFSNPKMFYKEFSTLKQTANEDILTIDLKPAQNSIKNLYIKINTKNLNITEMSFVDDVETKTTLIFSNVKTNAKMSKNIFQFKPEKSDEVVVQ